MPSAERRTVTASLAAVASVFAASACCLPVTSVVFAAGLAGASTVLQDLRPLLLAAALASIGYGFLHARRAARCRQKTGLLASVLLWASTALVIAAILFPQLLANAIAALPVH